MAQKRRQYVKTANGLEEQYMSSHADIVKIDPIDGLDAGNVQDALESLVDIANTGGVTGVTGVKGNAETTYRQGQVNITPANIGLGNVTNDAQVKRSEMGKASGVATLDSTGKVPTSQLPAYVDDVEEYNTMSAFPTTGEAGKIYVAKDTNKTYRWGSTQYVEISASLALGTTSSTAYPGDQGLANALNIQSIQQQNEILAGALDELVDGTTKVKKAESADKLTTARKISLKGDATGEITFDGSADKEINMTLANSGVTAGTYSVLTVDAKGRASAGAQLVEWGAKGQSAPSATLAVGGLFFMLVE